MIEKVLSIYNPDWTTGFNLFISTRCQVIVERLVPQDYGNVRLKTLDWTVQHEAWNFRLLSIKRNGVQMLSSCLRHCRFKKFARN